MGTTSPFSTLFAKSPFKAMQEHMRVSVQCAALVPDLFAALIADDQASLFALQEQIFAMEGRADDIKNQVRSNLPRTLFLPVDRRDLLEILDLQDSIADTAQEIAGLLVSRTMHPTSEMHAPLMDMARRCVEACLQAGSIVEELDELVETGFTGRESDKVLAMIAVLDEVESDTDTMGIQLVRILFLQEEKLGSVSLMFWYQLIRWLGNLADYSEKVGDRLRLLIAH